MDWLNSTVNDLSNLSTLISFKANKFKEKKLNEENLTSYNDVLAIANSVKKLLNGIHTNYRMVEHGLEDQLNPWKVLSGLKAPENEIHLIEEELDNKENKPESVNDSITNETGLSDSETPPKLAEDDLPRSQPISCPNDREPENDVKMGKESSKDCNDLDNTPENIDSCKTIEIGSMGVNNQTTGEHFLNDDNNSQSKKWVGLLSDESSSEDDVEKMVKKDSDSVQDTLITNTEHVKNEDLVQNSSTIDDISANVTERGEKNSTEEILHGDNESRTVIEKDAQCNEALQSMLCTSSEDDTKSSLSDSSSDESDDILLDDSDLDIGSKKPRILVKKQISGSKNTKKESGDNINKVEASENPNKTETKKREEELDSEAEIEMLTDMTKLKKKTLSRRLTSVASSGEESESENDSDNDQVVNIKKAKKYNNESKKRREEERNELFRFLDSNCSSEEEVDISKQDLDVIEDQYGSSSESMTFEDFSQKMMARMHKQQQEQEEMNLKILLAPDSDEGSVGGDDIVLEDGMKKKKKGPNKKVQEDEEDNVNKDEDNIENKEEDNVKEEKSENEGIKTEPDDEYEQFLEDLSKRKTTFKGLGSSSEETDHEDNIEIKEKVVDGEEKIKKEPNESDMDRESSDDSSGDIFLDKSKKKSMKKKSWRSNKLLHIKLSDTDTSDEERFWQRRLDKEKKKKEELGDSDSSGYDAFAEGLRRDKPLEKIKKKEDNGSDKENKKEIKKEKGEDEGGSSTLELSSSESSGSVIIKKKKRKKNETSDSEVVSISEDEKKKKKRKKQRNLSSDSSDESNESGDDVINISQKSTQGESPGKGGRKNIRKVLTKHELAAATKAAAKEEEERKKRIAARQKLFNEMFEIKEAEVLQKLVLDFDPETKTELISVDHDLVTKMKPHQAKGVKFMWDSCFESLSQLKTKKGSGCILAHCMGLGKTFQVISLVHTILKHKDTNVKTVLVVCPLSTVLNWYSEFDKWLDDVAGGRDIKVFHLTKHKRDYERSRQLLQWHEMGGVMILGYELFRILTNPTTKKYRLKLKNDFQRTLVDPGADLVVCDEGHMLKNESTVLSKAMSRIKTLRRIVLTGTPMQNNLKEYHCMVQFVKPNLLGTRKEFLNQFVNPITNGQFVDSTESDVKVMKRRAHVLHKMLEGLVQRFDYSVLTPFLPPKHEYVISLRLTEVQVRLYQFYLDNFSQTSNHTRTGSQLFSDWQALGRIWTHPRVLKMSTDKAEKEREKQRLEESEEEEGSIKDFIDDKSSSLSLSSGGSSSSDENNEKKENKAKEKTVANKATPNICPMIETEINLISSDEDEVKVAENKSDTVEEENLVEETKDEQEHNKEDSENSCKENIIDLEQKEAEQKLERKVGDDEVNLVEDEVNKEESTDDKENIENEDKEENIGNENKEENTGNNNQEETIENKNQEENIGNKDKEEKTDKQEKDEKAEEIIKKKPMDSRSAWWKDIVEPEHLDDINQSAKLILLFAILRECEMIEDKVLVFSQSLFSLDLIEYFLEKVDKATEENRIDQTLGNHTGCWTRGLDYFRLDGSSSSENRSAWCKTFNREDNARARLFLISTRAGGLGINLTGANRVVIFDASWNPSHDVQSIFRIYRFGQKKPCYVYRFIAHGTMEEKVYDRQVAKQSLSSRVVDEQQVHRHFSMNDLNELYRFTPPTQEGDENRPTPALPKDRLMAELLTQYKELIEKYHEHDSLLENIVEEELNEEERKLAWEDFQNDKKKIDMPGPGTSNLPGINMSQQELFRRSLRLKYPNSSEAEMNAMLQTLMFQVSAMAVQKSQQFAKVVQQPQQNTSTSQIGGLKNYQMMSTPDQMFNLQRGQVANNYNQNVQPQATQRMGNSQIKQNQKQENMKANANHFMQMRMQQQANLARILNQKKQQVNNGFPQPIQNRQQTLQNRQQRSVQNRQQEQLVKNQQQPILFGQQRQYSVQNSRQVNNIKQQNQQRIQNRQQILQNRQQQTFQNRQPISSIQSLMKRNVEVTRTVKPMQSTSNGNQPQQVRQQSTTKLLSRPQSQGRLAINQVEKTQQQLQQEKIKQQISVLQQRKQMTLQQKLQEKSVTNAVNASAIQKRKLEEMKKRYAATRKNLSSDISVVEIEDEPSRPSGSSI
uniref:Transcriptional regulator ATRX n=1 Tax=Homalodisca liturata TaxID=320908 RepID=A0A1B6I3A5_9HEMI